VPARRAPPPPPETPPVSPDNEFVDLGLEPFIAAATDALGYEQPTPIQSEAIPIVLSGRDVIGSAQTGTGKTAAFALPILQKLRAHGDLRCLVLEPTRELASQVEEACRSYSKFTNLSTTVVFGGVGYGPQRDAIHRGTDIVVATPGRLLDHIGQGLIKLDSVQYLVLDEVDRMLDMGFLPDVKKIIAFCPKERQTLFFSATIPPELEKLTQWCLVDPHTIEIGRRRSPAETVTHAFYPVIQSQKFDLLTEILERTHYESVLIFCRTKNGADFVAGRLQGQGHKVAVLHSNRSQAERTDALKGFKSGKYEVMVATDLAARGLDIAGITHVINFDTPQHAEDYVHRIGRTGRAHAEGDAFTLLTEDEMKHAFAIERFIGQKVERKKLEDFPYQYSAVFASAEGEAKNVFRSRLYRGTKG
jgi:ATP-dependent RNA helicase RhlE